MNRGARREPLFFTDHHCAEFLGFVSELPPRFGLLVFSVLLAAVWSVACGSARGGARDPSGSSPGEASTPAAEERGPLTEEDLAPQERMILVVAAKAMDVGKYDEAVGLIEQLRVDHPDHYSVVHELALAHRLMGNPGKAVALLHPYERHLDDYMSAALGSALDEAGDPEGAIATLGAALERFPESGLLHSELGTVYYQLQDYDRAIELWERGIEVDPSWPSNYLRAANLYTSSNAPGNALIYGQVFRLLELGARRSEEMAVTMVETLRGAVTIVADGDGSAGKISLAPPAVIEVSDPQTGHPGGLVMPLVNDFELAMMPPIILELGRVPGQELSLAVLHGIWSGFIDVWWNPEGPHTRHDVRLFLWMRKARDAGHLEAYVYWLFGPAFPEESETWRGAHETELEAFSKWYEAHPLFADKPNIAVHPDAS